jgi:20S proteasome alpha/beta subunit
VTIGIAARCNAGYVVMASDRRISFGGAIPAADNQMIKQFNVGRRWQALFAGDDIGPAIPLIQRARDLLQERNRPPLTPKDEDFESERDVKFSMREAYRIERLEYASDKILSPSNLTPEELKFLGYAGLGSEFTILNRALRSFDLGIEFLVCGFDWRGFGKIFMVKNPGRIQNIGLLDYWAIGSGANIALAHLVTRPIGILPIAEVVYRVCEAKFSTESADLGIGADTTVSVMNRHGLEGHLSEVEIRTIRQEWEESKQKRSSSDTRWAIENRLKDQGVLPMNFRHIY